MTGDDVLALRKLWLRCNYHAFLPEATVLASADWLRYVRSMAAMLPADALEIGYPTEEEVKWAWPEGLCIVLEEPFTLNHTIVSKDRPRYERFDPGEMLHAGSLSSHGVAFETVELPAHSESQELAGIVIGIATMFPTTEYGKRELRGDPELYGIPILWIGTDPLDVVRGVWLPGAMTHAQDSLSISESTRLLLALLTALGHRLTSSVAVTGSRGERRRVQRELPSLRVLRLGSGASVRSGGHSEVNWSHRWIVRGHWREQACGPRHTRRRRIWIDPFVKGPEDKPFDERRTLWKA